MIEIERKFLVISEDFKNHAKTKTSIVQGFLNTHKERTVRVRLKGNQGFLTIKGQSSDDGVSRFEWESEISKSDAEALLKLCEPGIIDKIRYEVQMEHHLYEVDAFFGENEGLIVAEIELKQADEIFKKPDWLGREVTGELKYYNSNLSKSPYKTWKT